MMIYDTYYLEDPQSSGSFAKYRESLICKGLMRATAHDSVALTLPHFSAIVKCYTKG